ncbi:MAG: hypothetical protein ACKOTB_12205 [Planctomycetia bacterium]
MNLSRVANLPVVAFLAAVIVVGMPALARLGPTPVDDVWSGLRPQLHPVAGTLLFEDRPVAGAVVTFVHTEAGGGREFLAVSSTDERGRFWLRTFGTRGVGAVAGRHSIRVERRVPTGRMLPGPGMESILELGAIPRSVEAAIDGADGVPGGGASRDSSSGCVAFPGVAETVNVLPPRFADEASSGLKADVVPAVTNRFVIRLGAAPPEAADAGR